MTARKMAHALLCAATAMAAGCVMGPDGEHEVGRSAYAVVEQMTADGIDVGPVEELGPEAACECGNGISASCDYVYYPATEVCQAEQAGVNDIYPLYEEMHNGDTTYDYDLYCAMGTLFYYDHFNPSYLYDIAVYSTIPSGETDDILIDMYGVTTTGSRDWQDDCDNAATGTGSPVQTRCYAEPLTSDQVYASFRITLPDAEGSSFRVRGFRLCYDPD